MYSYISDAVNNVSSPKQVYPQVVPFCKEQYYFSFCVYI
jgi:hypothetical protein